MAERTTKNKFAYDRKYYEKKYSNAWDGNAARELEEDAEEVYYSDEEIYDEEYVAEDFYGITPEYEQEYEQEYEVQPEVRVKTRYNINPVAFIMMCITIIALMKGTYSYINLQSQINLKTKAVAAAKVELDDARAINASLETKLDAAVDRNMIYSVAVEKLNMKYPNENQTVYYEKAESGYVRQYMSIPTANGK